MSKRIMILLSLFLLLLAACGGADVETTPTRDGSEQDVFPRPTITPDNGYPAPATPTAVDESYPVPSPAPTLDPYPATESLVWVARPFGVQCEEGKTYETEAEARAALEAADIQVETVKTTSFPVCTACNCPTSEHYLAQIAETDLQKAEDLGWAVAPDEGE